MKVMRGNSGCRQNVIKRARCWKAGEPRSAYSVQVDKPTFYSHNDISTSCTPPDTTERGCSSITPVSSELI